MYTAQLPDKGPFVIRYPRGAGSVADWRCPFEEIKVGTGRKLKDGADVAVLSLGPIGTEAAKAIEMAEAKNPGLKVAHYDMRFLKPLDKEIMHEVGTTFKKIVTVEDGVVSGGLGSAVLEYLSENGMTAEVVRVGIPDEFVEHGTVKQLREICKMDAESICCLIS